MRRLALTESEPVRQGAGVMLVRGHTQGYSVAWGEVLAAERAASPVAKPGELQEWARIRQRNRRAELGRSDRPERRGRPPKPTDPAILRQEAYRIGSMLSRGYEPATIRRKLGLSRRQWDIRTAALLPRDRDTIWANLRAQTARNLRLFASIRQRALAMKRPAFGAAIRATCAMQELQTRLLAVGQSLGYYPSVQPEARATLEYQDARRELPNLEGSESDISTD